MRVLVLNNTRATLENPKRGSYVSSIGDCIVSAGFEVTYLLPRRQGSSPLGKLRAYLLFYADILRFDFKPFDLVYVNHYPFLALPLMFRFGAIDGLAIHWHGEDLLPASRAKKMLFSLLNRWIPRRALHFTPSRYFRDCLLQRVAAARVEVSPSGGVRLQHFAQKSPPDGTRPVRIGFASGLDQGKGYDELRWLIDNLNRLEQATGRPIAVHYIDYGRHKGALRELESRLGEKLVSWRTLPKSEMPGFYQAIDLLLFPTRRRAESLGLVPLEALATGVPVVASNGFACPEYVLPGVSGELFELQDREDMMRKLTQCIDCLHQYRPRQIVEAEYSFEHVSSQYRRQLPLVERNRRLHDQV